MSTKFAKLFSRSLPHTPTEDQERTIKLLTDFIYSGSSDDLFLLKGYAGTGKTTLVSTLIQILPKIGMKSALLAPTGRAAKVLANYSKQSANTIHKKIYFFNSTADGSMRLKLGTNKHKKTIFFIDEASMIPDNNTAGNFSQHSLLDDLVNYVYQGENCKIILIGDTAQLPPVGLDISPALDIDYLRASFSLDIIHDELTEVVRQERSSGILTNATSIREKLLYGDFELPLFKTKEAPHFHRITGSDFEEILNDTFNMNAPEDSVIITRSNKRANSYNNEIRNRILYKHEEISAGDYIMVVKNNYFWLPEDSKTGFIANGDIAEILKVSNIEELYGYRFANATIRLIDYPDEENLEVKLLIDTISSETPSLSYNENKKLYNTVMEDYKDIPQKKKRMEELKKNPYFNALQIKFSYALTCHKTQGGQWKNVFIDQGYFKEDMLGTEYLRWLYTAITRATENVYLVNFKDEFFEEVNDVFFYE
ncbi:MAG: AAA family ATPase [Bacteroidota bacterium]|nr:AAA family ATPase [Bacteroidota bacterium]